MNTITSSERMTLLDEGYALQAEIQRLERGLPIALSKARTMTDKMQKRKQYTAKIAALKVSLKANNQALFDCPPPENTVLYRSDSLIVNGQSYPVQYYQDAESTAVIIRVTLQVKTATITLHTDHPDYAQAAEALRQSDELEMLESLSFAQTRTKWEADHDEELTHKREARAAFMAAKQARKEAKPLPEWAGECIQGNGFVIRFDAFHRDTMVIFEGVPLPAVREMVKASGFYWAPTKGAWVRGLNAKAKRAAEKLAPKLAAMKQLYRSKAKRSRAV